MIPEIRAQDSELMRWFRLRQRLAAAVELMQRQTTTDAAVRWARIKALVDRWLAWEFGRLHRNG